MKEDSPRGYKVYGFHGKSYIYGFHTVQRYGMSEKRTSIQVYEPTRKELIRVRGELESENGKRRSLDDVILELIKFWREKHN